MERIFTDYGLERIKVIAAITLLAISVIAAAILITLAVVTS